MSNKIGKLIEYDPNNPLRRFNKHDRPIQHKPDYDAENRFELFLLDDGEKKVETKDETRKPFLPRYPHLFSSPELY